MKILYLSLKRKWYNEIASGRKKEEYRDITPYYANRLVGQKYDAVKFHCEGDSMMYKVEKITIATKIKKYVIHLGEEIKQQN